MLIGGEGARVLERVVAFGDGWIPNWAPDTLERYAELRRLAREADRGPLPVTIYAAPPDREVIAACEEAGIDRICFNLPSSDLGRTRDALDELGTLIAGR